MMTDRIRRHARLGLALGVMLGGLMLGAAPASALNDIVVSSCDPDCAIKPPKKAVFIRQYGDFDGNGAAGPIAVTLAKGQKKTVVRVDWQFTWFTTSATFRSFTLKLNNHFAAPLAPFVNDLDSCGGTACTRSGVAWFDIDAQEAVVPGDFYGKPLTVTMTSQRAADANGMGYQLTLAAQIVKK